MPPGYHPQGFTALFSSINLLLLAHEMRLWSANLWHWMRVSNGTSKKNRQSMAELKILGFYGHSRWNLPVAGIVHALWDTHASLFCTQEHRLINPPPHAQHLGKHQNVIRINKSSSVAKRLLYLILPVSAIWSKLAEWQTLCSSRLGPGRMRGTIVLILPPAPKWKLKVLAWKTTWLLRVE